MPDDWLSDTRSSYDTDASGYAEQVRGLLDGNPCLRASLAMFAELVRTARERARRPPLRLTGCRVIPPIGRPSNDGLCDPRCHPNGARPEPSVEVGPSYGSSPTCSRIHAGQTI